MELKLFGSKSVFASGLAHNGRTCSSFRHVVGVRFFPHFCSCRGTFSRVSNSTYLSKRAITSGDVYRITGTSGAISMLFSRNIRLLDFFDYQYEGVVVDPERLPANPNVFASRIRPSLSHWRRMVLVVQEKYCNPSFTGLWKLPTGFILESEEIYKRAIREVKEETGIDSEFVEVVAFRHAHEVIFEKLDLFFVCILKPVSSQIKVDDLEIQDAKIMYNLFINHNLICTITQMTQIKQVILISLA
ncbi:hypothetical protein Ddye_016445 [Dipteronia dyeriana]|uniref:Nudix hydrolase domain-containing protein n=1 Tax=Dipteronia dyeriana TaxID=168575 RepID=A0AAD9U6T3_9ROSI|nr:hypothetical protein Ddye_016445 [Dipteronia dyeriana]